MTVAVATGAAAKIPGTIVSDILGQHDSDCVRLGHSSGVTDVLMKMDGEKVLQGGVSGRPGVSWTGTYISGKEMSDTRCQMSA